MSQLVQHIEHDSNIYEGKSCSISKVASKLWRMEASWTWIILFQKKNHYNIFFNFATCYGWLCCSLEATWDYED
jgi:hypothetical protein